MDAAASKGSGAVIARLPAVSAREPGPGSLLRPGTHGVQPSLLTRLCGGTLRSRGLRGGALGGSALRVRIRGGGLRARIGNQGHAVEDDDVDAAVVGGAFLGCVRGAARGGRVG